MKKLFALALIVAGSLVARAQNPVSWTFTAKKIADQTYEIHMTANIQSGWHLYSQVQPDNAVANPTEFTINNNPLFTLDGKIKEDGKMEKYLDTRLDIGANQYSNKVNFVQVVKLKTAKAKTNVAGKVEFQTCNDEKCLPPKTITFSVALQ
ncbi:MAG TPA: protein-disulfide reductase DsbD domain-containing protein [Chitinophagaceae bacterium]|nr:protein-disulfide reductase DsbD domain-containing protein [Chitinophagaceae bacterium]